MENDKRLYFITGKNKENRYIYKYILAFNRSEAKEQFESNYSEYDIVEFKTLSPNKKLLKKYDEIKRRYNLWKEI